MDYTVLTNQELQAHLTKIYRAYMDRQDYKSHKASGAKVRLYNILKDNFPGNTHEERLISLQSITELDFLKYRNAGLTGLSRAVYELEEMGMKFKSIEDNPQQ